MPITNFRAFWHPGMNTFGIEVIVQGQRHVLRIDSPQEFIAVLAVLNGPAPTMTPQGHITCER